MLEKMFRLNGRGGALEYLLEVLVIIQIIFILENIV